MQNPYLVAAVRKQQRDRAMRLPAAQPADHPEGRHAADFFEGLASGGPKANMIRNIRCSAAARQMDDVKLAEVLAFLSRGRQREADRLAALGAPPVIVQNALKPCLGAKVLQRELRKRGL